MSTNYYFAKNIKIPLTEIFEKTPIKRYVDSDDHVWLALDEDHIYPLIRGDSDLVVGLERKGHNSIGGVLYWLVKVFDLYFISEFEEYEGCDSSDEFLEAFRKPIVDRILLENKVNELILEFGSPEDLIVYIINILKKQ